MRIAIIITISAALLGAGCNFLTPPSKRNINPPPPATSTIAPTVDTSKVILEFKTENPNPPVTNIQPDGTAMPDLDLYWIPTELSDKQLRHASVVNDNGSAGALIRLEFTAEGKQIFARLTQENVGKRIAIVLDGEIISAPTVQTAITDGVAIISGNFSVAEATTLAERLNATTNSQ